MKRNFSSLFTSTVQALIDRGCTVEIALEVANILDLEDKGERQLEDRTPEEKEMVKSALQFLCQV